MPRTVIAAAVGLIVAASCGDDDEPGDAATGMESAPAMTMGATSDGTTTPGTSGTDDSSDGSSSSSGGDDVDPDVLALCECLLVSCHDPFHAKYGEADMEAGITCREEASGLPPEGDGDTVQCRLDACTANTCEPALGPCS